jgi:hypothetical protein
MTKDEKKHLDSVAQLGCVVCARLGYGETPAEIHHPRIKSRGIGLKASTTIQFLYVPSTIEDRVECMVWEPKGLLSTTGLTNPIYSKPPKYFWNN